MSVDSQGSDGGNDPTRDKIWLGNSSSGAASLVVLAKVLNVLYNHIHVLLEICGEFSLFLSRNYTETRRLSLCEPMQLVKEHIQLWCGFQSHEIQPGRTCPRGLAVFVLLHLCLLFLLIVLPLVLLLGLHLLFTLLHIFQVLLGLGHLVLSLVQTLSFFLY